MNKKVLGAVIASSVMVGSNAWSYPLGILDQDGGYLDFISANITTGASVWPFSRSLREDGTSIPATPNIFEYREYTTQQVQLGRAEDIDESYIEDFGLIGKMFASSVANGAGDLEVGADGRGGASRAWSYFSLTVKNQRSRPVNLQFAFDIPAGEVLTNDPARYPATDQRRAHATVHAGVGAYLKSPDEEEPGTWEESEHTLFDFYVDMYGSCAFADSSCAGVVVDYSANAAPYISDKGETPGTSIFGVDIAAYSGLLSLPEIPPFGELTVFYNMYALGSGYMESAARGMLGDPLSIGEGGGIRLIEIDPVTPGETVGVPEPATLSLLGAGMLAIGVRRRRRFT